MKRVSISVLFVTALAAVAIGRPVAVHAEPIPIELQRLPGVTVELYNDLNGDGLYGASDVAQFTVTDSSGWWNFSNLSSHPYIVVQRVGTATNAMRIGGDLRIGNTHVNGVPVKRLWDTSLPIGYFLANTDFRYIADDQLTRCLAPTETCGDFRLDARTRSEDVAVVLAVSAGTHPSLNGWLWDATYDND